MPTDRVTIVSQDAGAVERLSQVLRAAGFDVAPAVSCLSDLPELCDRAEGDWVLADGSAGREEFAPATLEEIERRHVAATLNHTGGNKRHAAHLLGIARSTLQQKVRRYGLDRRFE